MSQSYADLPSPLSSPSELVVPFESFSSVSSPDNASDSNILFSTLNSSTSFSSSNSDTISIPDNLFGDSYVVDEPDDPLDNFVASLNNVSGRQTLSETCENLRNLDSDSSTSASYSPRQLAALWISRQFSKNSFLPSALSDDPPAVSTNLYKKVANKVRPVATTLPENFRIIRKDHPNPLAKMLPLPKHPPEFVPTGRFTQERRDQMAIGKDFLGPEEIKLAEWIMCTHNQAFAWNDDERGSFGPPYFAPVEIPIISHIPWRHRQGPIPRGILEELTKVVKEKRDSGVYEPSSSSYNTRWFCVLKKDKKSLRIVHSLEPLNAVSIKNAALPPYTDLVAEEFAGCGIFTTLDLYVSFDQRPLHVRSRDMTTFTTPLGAFRITALPMGWTNSPAVLQGDVSHIYRSEIPNVTIPFADDIGVKGPKTRYELPDGGYETIPENPSIRRFVWEHFLDLHRILERGKAYGITFSGKKAWIGIPQAEILGSICTYEGRIADPARIQKIVDWPVPTNVSEVRSFLGVCGVLRIFIKNYTIIARPLIQLTRKDAPFEIGPDQLEAIAKLKELISTSSALKAIDYESDQPVILAVDSCMNGVGYILLQIGEDGKRYPSRFGSITFNERESRYSQAKLELYGLLRALKQTQLYTIGIKKFVVEMDAKFIKGMINNPTLHPNDAVNRWISAILLFDFKLVHVPADKHTGADGLSRRPRAPEDPPSEDPEEIEDWIDTNGGLFLEHTTPASSYDSSPAFPMAFELASVLNVATGTQSNSEESVSENEIPRSTKALRREAKLDTVRKFLTTLERPPNLSDDAYRQFIRYAMDYSLLGKNFYRKDRDGHYQLIPKTSNRFQLIQYAHDTLGHKGIYATTRNLLLRFWWPHLSEDVRWFIRTCHECQIRQTEYFHIPPVIPEVPSLFRKAHIDTFFMPKAGNYRYVHHARDALTSYPEARAATSDNAETIADFIFREILCRWGALEEIVSDNGTPYIAALEVLGKRYGIRHIRISGYNSRANGIVESKHFDVRESIVKACEGHESKWRHVLPQVLWAERITIRKATGYSPYYMVHGVHPLLPFDIIESTYLSPPQDGGMSTEDLVALRARQLSKRPEDLESMRDVVSKSRIKFLERWEKKHSSRIVDFDFKPGALVLVRNTRIKDTLNKKTKPRYLGPMIVVRKTIGTSYIVAELDGAQSHLRVAGFRLIPYLLRTETTIPISSGTLDDNDPTEDDPEDIRYFESIPQSRNAYETIPFHGFR